MEESEMYPKVTRRATSSSNSAATTSVHVTALDGLVNVNSLFTIAVFVGLSLTTPGQKSLEDRTSCDAGIDVVKKLLVFEVVSFSFFLFSSLVAQGLKLAINLLNSKDVDEGFRAHINLKVLRLGMLGSAVGSVMGCLFLMLSMVNVIEIRLGVLSCGSKSTIHAVTALIILGQCPACRREFIGSKSQTVRCASCGNIVWHPKGDFFSKGCRGTSSSESEQEIIDVEFEENCVNIYE